MEILKIGRIFHREKEQKTQPEIKLLRDVTLDDFSEIAKNTGGNFEIVDQSSLRQDQSGNQLRAARITYAEGISVNISEQSNDRSIAVMARLGEYGMKNIRNYALCKYRKSVTYVGFSLFGSNDNRQQKVTTISFSGNGMKIEEHRYPFLYNSEAPEYVVQAAALISALRVNPPTHAAAR